MSNTNYEVEKTRAIERDIEAAIIAREEVVFAATEKETIFNVVLEMKNNVEELEITIEEIRSVLYGDGNLKESSSDIENGCQNIEEILKDTKDILQDSIEKLHCIKEGLI